MTIAALVGCGTTPSEVALIPETTTRASSSMVAPSTEPACLAAGSTPLPEGRMIELSIPLKPPNEAKEVWSKRVLAAVTARLALGDVSDEKHECFDTAFFESSSMPATSVRVRTPPANAPNGCDRKKHADLSLVFGNGATREPPASALKVEDELYFTLDDRGRCTESAQKSFKLEKSSEGVTDAIAKHACGADCHASCEPVAVERWRVEHVAPGGCGHPEKVFLEIWSRGDERIADLSLAIGDCVDRIALAEVARSLHEALAPFAAPGTSRHKTEWAMRCGR